MYCKKIAVKVQHWDGPRQKKSSFFVVEVERDEDDDVFELIGIAKVDSHSMRRLRDWLRGEFKELTLLVSIDLKYVIVANRDELHHIYDAEQHVEVDLNGDAGVYGNPQHKFVHVIERDIKADPDLARLLGVKVRTARADLPSRIKLSKVMHGTLDEMDSPIRDAYQEPRKAKADELIFAFLAKENWYLRVEELQHQIVDHAVFGHCQFGDWNEGGQLRLYDTKGLTYSELLQRRKRAIKNRNSYWRNFPDPWKGSGDGSGDQFRRHFDRLSDDELVEMAVVAWYSSPQLAGREKSAVMAASARFGGSDDFR